MIKIQGYINYKSIFDLFCHYLFDDDYKACDHWWYNKGIVGLDNMFMSEICSTSEGRQRALDWANGYLYGKSGGGLQ